MARTNRAGGRELEWQEKVPQLEWREKLLQLAWRKKLLQLEWRRNLLQLEWREKLRNLLGQASGWRAGAANAGTEKERIVWTCTGKSASLVRSFRIVKWGEH